MNAVILTEGGQKSGFGHITRCLSLRDALRAQGISVSFVVNGDSSVCKQFRGLIDRFADWTTDKTELHRSLKGKLAVVIDSYHAPRVLYNKISRAVPVKVYIDDYVRLVYPKGVIMNGAIGAEKFPYPRQRAQKNLLGTPYMLIRKEFWRVPKKNIRPEVSNVLITFGGIDRFEAIRTLLKQLAPKFSNIQFHVVIITRFQRRYRMLARRYNNVKFYFNLDANRMRRLISSSDIAISGGGQTINELSRCGLPTIGICFANNQRLNIQGWEKMGFLKYAGDSSDASLSTRISKFIHDLNRSTRARMSAAGQRLIDGNGPKRVARAILLAMKKARQTKG